VRPNVKHASFCHVLHEEHDHCQNMAEIIDRYSNQSNGFVPHGWLDSLLQNLEYDQSKVDLN